MDREHLSDIAFRGDLALVTQLLAQGVSVEETNPIGRTPLLSAIEGGHLDVADVLLKAGADIRATGAGGDWPPLYAAVERACDAASQLGRNPDMSMVQLLLNHGADVNQTRQSGDTAIAIARRSGERALLELLLSNLRPAR